MNCVFITGASAGIGRALAFECASQGLAVVLFARRRDLLEHLKGEILQRYPAAAVCVTPGDVCQEEDLSRALAQAEADLGRSVDTVIANAGFSVSGLFENLTLADYQRQFDVNVFGVLKTLKATLPSLKKTRGQIGIVGSANSFVSLPGVSAYCMSKFAIRALGLSLENELHPFGVSVTLIYPGFVTSDIRKTGNDGVFHAQWQDPVPAWICMDTDLAARQMLLGLRRKRAEVIVTWHSAFLIRWVRFLPRLFQRIARALTARILRGRGVLPSSGKGAS
jgi:short-subunit dehydrogenase